MKRLYSLFEKRGHRYHRLSPLSYLRDVAVHVFQNSLLEAASTGRTLALRPVEDRWEGNRRIYRPAVEQFEPLKQPERTLIASDEPVVNLTELKKGERRLIPAQCRTYVTKTEAK